MGCALGVHRDWKAEACGAGHARMQRDVVDRRKVVHPAGTHEGLEPDHPSSRELVEPVHVPGHQPAREAEVDVGGRTRRLELAVEGRPVDRRRMGVERHVEETRGAAGGKRARSRAETLPVRPSGVVQVHVCVDDAGQNMEAGAVDLLARATLECGRDCCDRSVGDADVRPRSPRASRPFLRG